MSLESGAKTAVDICLGIKKRETALIITDTETEKIGQALFKAASESAKEALYVVMKPRSRHGEEPPDAILEMMKRVDVIIAPTRFSLTHTQARKIANRMGARIATMPGITEEMMSKGGMTADFKEVERSIRKLAKHLKGKTAHLTTPLGTDLEMKLNPKKWIFQDTGICKKPGLYINLPAGEVFIPPNEGTANGTLFIDGAFPEKLDKPVEVEIKDGMAEKFKGASKVQKALDKQGKKARNVAELGIGMNPKAKIIGNVLEDEKVLGTVHIAFGDNSTFGGKVKCGIHVDGIITKPTLEIDDVVVLNKGKLIE